MKLEKGMYVRTTGDAYEPSKIGKIKEVDITSFKEVCYRIDSCGKHILIPESFIKKNSFNIIDLIEVGDYVNGYKVISKPFYDSGYITFGLSNNTNFDSLCEIKEILTHEEYEANCYKVGE